MPLEFNNFGRISSEAARKAQVLLDATQAAWVAGAQHDAPFRDGDLKQSIGPAPGMTPFERRVVATSDHAAPQEFGSVAHIIAAKNASVLTDGENFFGKVVHHPGNPPHPFMRPQEEKLREPFMAGVRKLQEGR